MNFVKLMKLKGGRKIKRKPLRPYQDVVIDMLITLQKLKIVNKTEVPPTAQNPYYRHVWPKQAQMWIKYAQKTADDLERVYEKERRVKRVAAYNALKIFIIPFIL